MKRYDAIVIGYGQGAGSIVGTLSAEGWQVALIEKDPMNYGGSCINVGCIPTKLLDHDAKNGVSYEDAVNRRNHDIEEKRQGQKQTMIDNPNVDLYTGIATFRDNHSVDLTLLNGEELTLESDVIVIATGSKAVIPDIKGIEETENIYTSKDLQVIKHLPERLGVMGAGNIGLEFASIYANFGSKVYVFDSSEQFMADEEPEIAQTVKESLEERGVVIHSDTRINAVENQGKKVIATSEDGESFTLDALLIATGRQANIEDLGLENTDIQLTDAKGIAVDDYLQTAVEGVYAIGDVRGEEMFTYVTLQDAAIVKNDLLSDGDRLLSQRQAIPYTIFVDPPLARVGLTEARANEKGLNIVSNVHKLKDTPNATVLDDHRGVFKAVVDADTNLILGASLFGTGAHDLINQVKMAMDNDIPASYIAGQMMTHPTQAEQLNNAFNV